MKKNKLLKNKNQYLLNVFILCLLISFVVIYFLRLFFPDKSSENIATTIAGVLGTAFSFFGSILVYKALMSQIKANEQVQKQFEKQELKDYLQNFESKFFNLINLHHQIISDIDIDCEKIFHHENDLKEFIKENDMVKKTFSSEIISNEKHTSRDVFKYVYNILDYLLCIDKWIIDDKKYADENIEDVKKFVLIFNENYSVEYGSITRESKFPQIYNTIYSLVNTDLGHYFRNLYSIVKFVDNTKFSEDVVEDYKVKYNYLSILRAQLSDAELYVIFLNCIYYYGNEKFKPLLEKYSFFKVIPINDDEDNIFSIYNKFYEKIAFHPLKKDEDIRVFLDKSVFQKVKINIIEEPDIKLEP